jgi:hypothetical protein
MHCLRGPFSSPLSLRNWFEGSRRLDEQFFRTNTFLGDKCAKKASTREIRTSTIFGVSATLVGSAALVGSGMLECTTVFEGSDLGGDGVSLGAGTAVVCVEAPFAGVGG